MRQTTIQSGADCFFPTAHREHSIGQQQKALVERRFIGRGAKGETFFSRGKSLPHFSHPWFYKSLAGRCPFCEEVPRFQICGTESAYLPGRTQTVAILPNRGLMSSDPPLFLLRSPTLLSYLLVLIVASATIDKEDQSFSEMRESTHTPHYSRSHAPRGNEIFRRSCVVRIANQCCFLGRASMDAGASGRCVPTRSVGTMAWIVCFSLPILTQSHDIIGNSSTSGTVFQDSRPHRFR